MTVFGRGHEEVHFFHDEPTGLRAIVAIYSTALGPSLGGTRFRPYASEDEALADVLNLSEAMAYKNACGGLDLGGGKAVIIGDPARDKSEELFLAYGRCLQTLGGRYYTACDVGTYVEDMDIVKRVCEYATGGSTAGGGAGDSSELTAVGVFASMRAAAQHVWGEPTLRGKRVGIAGAGKVGSKLAGHLLDDGAQVVICDVVPAAIEKVRAAYPDVEVVAPEAIAAQPVDVFSPCALGGALTSDVVAQLHAQIVCGGANNQLATPEVDDQLVARGITYVPDFVANVGGVIQVGAEVHGYSQEVARTKAEAVFDTTAAILAEAAAQGSPATDVAMRRAEARMRAARA